MSDARLRGKVALVTGAARGLGFASAAALAREGAQVVLADVREDLVRAAAASIGPACSMVRYEMQRRASSW